MKSCNVCHNDYTGAYMRCQACGRLSRANGEAVATGIGMLALWSRARVEGAGSGPENGHVASYRGEHSGWAPTEGMALRSLWEKLRHPLRGLATREVESTRAKLAERYANAMIGCDFGFAPSESTWSVQYMGKPMPVPEPKPERPRGDVVQFAVGDVVPRHGKSAPLAQAFAYEQELRVAKAPVPADVVNDPKSRRSTGWVGAHVQWRAFVRAGLATRPGLGCTTFWRARDRNRVSERMLADQLGAPTIDCIRWLLSEQERVR